MLQAVLNSGVTRRRSPRNGRDTREEILNCAEELLQRRGYNAFSYQHIAVQLGIRNAAIHYHFPAKEDLGVALVQRYRQRFRDWCEQMAAEPDAWTRLQAYFKTTWITLKRNAKSVPVACLDRSLRRSRSGCSRKQGC